MPRRPSPASRKTSAPGWSKAACASTQPRSRCIGQPFVKDPDTTVEQLLKKAGARVVGFDRLEVGEGIDKQADDFVAEVMKQARG